MPRLTFRLDFKTSELRSLDLPVELRKPNATLIRTALTSETIEIPAGEYYATMQLPGGQRLVTPFHLTDPPVPDPFQVVLAPDPEDESAHEWEEVSHYLGHGSAQQMAPLERDRSASESFGAEREVLHWAGHGTPPVERDRSALESFGVGATSRSAPESVPYVCIYSGNVVRRTHVPEPPAPILSGIQSDPNRLVQFVIPPSSKLLILQLVQAGGPVQNMALPVSPEAGMQVVIGRRPGSGFYMEAHLKNHAADMLLQYSSYGATGTATVAGRSPAVDGERLLRDKLADPIGAAVGAYSILRIGDVTRLHDWTAYLRDRFTWLPDGAAIHGEHLARMGRHGAAVDAFAQIPERGLPLFSDGLFYAVERLKLYVTRTWKGNERVDAGRAQSVLTELQPFVLLMRRLRPISTYPGVDVSAPDATPAPENFTSPHSLDLRQWFRPRAADGAASSEPPAGAASV